MRPSAPPRTRVCPFRRAVVAHATLRSAPRRQAVPGCRGVETAIFDLADLGSVREWGKRAQDVGLPLDVLVNNAGVMACPELRTKDGFELQLGVNHLVRWGSDGWRVYCWRVLWFQLLSCGRESTPCCTVVLR